MNGDVEAEAPRPRPLSGGLWTLFSWLRREERASSSDSLSSAGSDRTAASFAYLAPAHYHEGAPPLLLPPSGPPTDSYKKRVLERNLRRQHDRDITLHRKYGLYRSEGGNGYDNFSLPQARRPAGDSIGKWDRERRAASESVQGRVLHVPGKRRAPLPPVLASSAGPSTPFPRRPRKRPAPQPPIKLIQETKENIAVKNSDILIPMNSHTVRDEHPPQNNDVSMGCKSEKYSKKDVNSKTVKVRSEKSFLKQIFDNRKRNSAIETTTVRILPSISELDKQAAELIENNKLKKAVEQNCNFKITDNEHKQSELHQIIRPSKGESWICTTCLRKYDGSMAACLYCVHERSSTSTELHKPFGKNVTSASENYTQTENCSSKSSSNRNHVTEEKQKLKEMLKEMKDSLPKRLILDNKDIVHTKNSAPLTQSRDKNTTLETPTLRIGSPVLSKNKIIKPSCSSVNIDEPLQTNKCVLVSQHVVLEHTAKIKENVKLDESCVRNPMESITMNSNSPNKNVNENAHKENLKSEDTKICNHFDMTSTQKRNLNTPLKISSLLNPVYIPKNKIIIEKIPDISVQKVAKNSDALSNTTAKSAFLMGTSVNSPSTSYHKTSVINVEDGVSLALKENKIKDQTAQITTTQNETSTSVIKSKNTSPLKDVKLKEKNKQVTITQEEKLTLSNDPKDFSEIKENKLKETTNQVTTTYKEKQTSPNEIKGILEIREDKPKDKTKQGDKPISPNNTNINLPVNKPSDCLTINKKESEMSLPTSSIEINSTSNMEKVNQHTRRRELINQLEQSIAKGDEIAAAEAAVKLAQLRLSCSVLSFSSQIVSEPSTSSSNCKTSLTKLPENSDIVNKSPNKIKCKKAQPVNTPSLSTSNAQAHLTEKSTQLGLANNIKPISTTREIIPITLELKPVAVNNNKCGGDKQVTPQVSTEDSTSKQKENDKIPIGVWVEDKEAARGPIQLIIERQAVMGELRRQAEMALGLPTRLQRWIIGRTLCTDDTTPLISLAGPLLNAPFYLCVVESETNAKSLSRVQDVAATCAQKRAENRTINFYTELVQLEQQALVPNPEVFECGVCMEECVPGGGVILRECAVHTFCRQCLADVIRHSEEPVVSCPAMGCKSALQEREIRGLVSAEEYERWLARGLTAAESGTRNAFHCRTRDCTGWALCEPGVQRFPCPVCKHNNCVPCQAIHEGDTCEQYRVKLETVSNVDSTQVDDSTRALLNTLIKKGEALECPECKAIITKKWGCDWVKCSACKTEICWVTRGRRWGPLGRGDISAGCRCGIDGKRCHPSCGYCH